VLNTVLINSLLKQHKLTRGELAEIIGISNQMVTYILQRKRTIKVEYLYTIASYFEVSMDELWKPVE